MTTTNATVNDIATSHEVSLNGNYVGTAQYINDNMLTTSFGNKIALDKVNVEMDYNTTFIFAHLTSK